MTQTKQQTGFTILELIVTIAIAGILFAFAAPNFSNTLARSAVRNAASEWQESFYFAQSEAMRLQGNVLLCASKNGTSCGGENDSDAEVTFADGWIVLDQNNNYVLRDIPESPNPNLTITSRNGRNTYTFNGAGRLTQFVGDTLTFSLSNNNGTYTQTLTLNTEGRIR